MTTPTSDSARRLCWAVLFLFFAAVPLVLLVVRVVTR
jgi:hypothetical protein